VRRTSSSQSRSVASPNCRCRPSRDEQTPISTPAAPPSLHPEQGVPTHEQPVLSVPLDCHLTIESTAPYCIELPSDSVVARLQSSGSEGAPCTELRVQRRATAAVVRTLFNMRGKSNGRTAQGERERARESFSSNRVRVNRGGREVSGEVVN
jgi:hypothetical protein